MPCARRPASRIRRSRPCTRAGGVSGRNTVFTSLQREAPASEACNTVEALVRARFALAGDVHVVVDERAPTLPGCPPWETVVDFWTDLADGSTLRHHCKVFKPAAEVVADDLPPYWMKPALAVSPNYACDCC